MAQADRKSPWEAAILGILMVGLGHFYLRMWSKGIALILVTIFVAILTSFLVAPVFWIISGVWAYYDAKSYNREAGYPEEERDSDEEEEEEEMNIDDDAEEERDSDEEEEGEEMNSDEYPKELHAIRSSISVVSDELLKELRGIRSTMNFVLILLLIMLGLMLYVFFHLTRLVLAP